MEPEKQNSSALMIPGAILLAGLFIAGSIFYTRGGAVSGDTSANVVAAAKANPSGEPSQETLDKMQPITAADHILGSPTAPVKLVEYSDLECPFCKQFHKTVQQVVEEYGKSGKVAIVFRQFPLVQLHPKAHDEAQASECAASLGGNDKFWDFIDGLFAVTPSNNGLDLEQLPVIAGQIGLNKTAFSACLSSGKFKDKVDAQVADATLAGGTGTPFSIIVAPNGKKFPVSGAYPYATVKAKIEQALAEK